MTALYVGQEKSNSTAQFPRIARRNRTVKVSHTILSIIHPTIGRSGTR